jgi:dTDP-4-dehydrorhamnose 3,5-epimerase
MTVTPFSIAGVFGLPQNIKSDSRGSLIRVWDRNLEPYNFDFNQSSVVTNPHKGTLRGLHFQSEPFAENKIVECVGGKVFDVVVDLRKDSLTFGKHLTLELGPNSQYMGVFIPAGCAHGYLSLESNSTLIYFMDRPYSKLHARGLRWDDSRLAINWPESPSLISDADKSWPLATL